MGSPRTDLAMWSAAPGAVPAPAFKTTRRGYDPTQVDDHIRRMTERSEVVENQVRKLRAELERARGERDTAVRERDSALEERAPADALTYEQVSSRMADLMMGVDREVERIRAEAEAEADRIVADARNEASRLQTEAEGTRFEADRAARRAREDVERSLVDVTSQRDAMLDELRLIFARLLDAIAALEGDPSTDTSAGRAAASPVEIPDVQPDREQ